MNMLQGVMGVTANGTRQILSKSEEASFGKAVGEAQLLRTCAAPGRAVGALGDPEAQRRGECQVTCMSEGGRGARLWPMLCSVCASAALFRAHSSMLSQ